MGYVLGKDGQPVSQVRRALHTDSKIEAQAKIAQIEASRMAEWEAMEAGDSGSARAHYKAAKKLAQARGFQYRSLNTLVDGPVDELLARLKDVRRPDGSSTPLEGSEVIRAVMGNATRPARITCCARLRAARAPRLASNAW